MPDRSGSRTAHAVAMLGALTTTLASCLADLPPPDTAQPSADGGCTPSGGPAATKCDDDLHAIEMRALPCGDQLGAAIHCIPIADCASCGAPANSCDAGGATVCPPAIAAAYPGAQCLSFDTQRLGPGCVACARDGCAAACDGRGPVFGYTSATATGDQDLVVDSTTPSGGLRFGIYARVRGTGAVKMTARAGGTHFIDQDKDVDSADFVDVMFTTPNTVPDKGILAGTAWVPTRGSILEIDCVIPFSFEAK